MVLSQADRQRHPGETRSDHDDPERTVPIGLIRNIEGVFSERHCVPIEDRSTQ
ncbi:MAG: hypothetical protein ACOYMR_17620 [Ilumatobacteraceae bacterium]